MGVLWRMLQDLVINGYHFILIISFIEVYLLTAQVSSQGKTCRCVYYSIEIVC